MERERGGQLTGGRRASPTYLEAVLATFWMSLKHILLLGSP
jgi:hypothetical protein